MTDIEKLRQTLTEIGVNHTADDDSIEIEHPDKHSSFGGYAGLFTFDESGKFEEFRVTA